MLFLAKESAYFEFARLQDKILALLRNKPSRGYGVGFRRWAYSLRVLRRQQLKHTKACREFGFEPIVRFERERIAQSRVNGAQLIKNRRSMLTRKPRARQAG